MRIRAVSIVIIIAISLVSFYLISFLTRQEIQGVWKEDHMLGEFHFYPSSKEGGMPTLTFTDKEFSISGSGPEWEKKHPNAGARGTYSCDETKSPKQITFNFNGRTVVGIYRFWFGQLQICIGEDETVAPTEFTRAFPSLKMSGPALLVFKRFKDN